MGTTLNAMMVDAGDDSYYSDEYITFMASHMKFIREHASTKVVELDQTLVHKNMNDFTGLFMDMGIRYQDYPVLLMINGISDPLDLTSEVTSLMFPDGVLIDNLKTMFRTTVL